jgi:hypothetical protein
MGVGGRDSSLALATPAGAAASHGHAQTHRQDTIQSNLHTQRKLPINQPIKNDHVGRQTGQEDNPQASGQKQMAGRPRSKSPRQWEEQEAMVTNHSHGCRDSTKGGKKRGDGAQRAGAANGQWRWTLWGNHYQGEGQGPSVAGAAMPNESELRQSLAALLARE